MVKVEELREHAADMLEEGRVRAVIGYRRSTAGPLAEPCTLEKVEEAESLVWDPTCLNNLALFLVKESKRQAAARTPDKRPLGIVAKGCDSRAVTVLLQENYFKREDVVVLGVSCEGSGVVDPIKLSEKLKGRTADKVEFADEDGFKVTVGGEETTIPAQEILADRCIECREPSPSLYDFLFGEPATERDFTDPFHSVKAAQEATEEERWATWQHHFDRCLRCFACRAVCPMCYCPECIVDSTTFVVTPQTSAEEKASRIRWCERSPEVSESAVYHLTRALHLAGRCIDCGECERVCPVNIPLRLLNTKLEMEAMEMFDYEAGRNVDVASLISSFRDEDPNSFIR